MQDRVLSHLSRSMLGARISLRRPPKIGQRYLHVHLLCFRNVTSPNAIVSEIVALESWVLVTAWQCASLAQQFLKQWDLFKLLVRTLDEKYQLLLKFTNGLLYSAVFLRISDLLQLHPSGKDVPRVRLVLPLLQVLFFLHFSSVSPDFLRTFDSVARPGASLTNDANRHTSLIQSVG